MAGETFPRTSNLQPPILPPGGEGYPAIDPAAAVVLGSPEAHAILNAPQPDPAEEARRAHERKVQAAVAEAYGQQAEAQSTVRDYDASKRDQRTAELFGDEPQEIFWIERKGEDGSGSDVYAVPSRGYTSVNGRVVPGLDTRLYKPNEVAAEPEPVPEPIGVLEVEPRGTGVWGLVRHVRERRLRTAQQDYNKTALDSAVDREAAAVVTERRKFRPELRPTTGKQHNITRRAIKIENEGRAALLERWKLSRTLGGWEGADADTGSAYVTRYATNPDGSYQTTPDGKPKEEILRDRQGRRIVISDLGTAMQEQRIKDGRYSRKERRLEKQVGKAYNAAEHHIEHAGEEMHHLAHNPNAAGMSKAGQHMDKMDDKVRDARAKESAAASRKQAKKDKKAGKAAQTRSLGGSEGHRLH